MDQTQTLVPQGSPRASTGLRANPIRIVIADDYPLVLDIFSQTLGSVEDFDVVGGVTSPADIMPTLRRDQPSVVLFGMSAAHFECVPTIERVRRDMPDCGIALIVPRPTQALIDRAISAGALSVIARNSRLSQLIGAIRGVAAGCLTLDPALLPISGNHVGLSDRERHVLSLTATGASVKEIAAELYLSVGTVRNLSSAAIQKLQGRNRFDAARIAMDQGWL
ncbi:MAG: response regulator transcription factor [Angustibacter sp.]